MNSPVRDGKGGKDRLTLLPQSLVPVLQEHLIRVRSLHQADLAAGWGRVLLTLCPGPEVPQRQP